MFTVDELLSKRNQKDALAHFDNKRDSRGSDGLNVSELKDYWELNKERIMEEIKQGIYEPRVIENYEILNNKGKKREISNLAVIDRFITRLLSQKLRRYIEPEFASRSFAYQENKGILDAVMVAQSYIEQGKLFLAEIDLKNYFDTISLEKLLSELEIRITDIAVRTLIRKYLYCKIEKENQIINKSVGLVQGNSISPILSNLYLHPLDLWMEEQDLFWMRFADNIYVFEQDKQPVY